MVPLVRLPQNGRERLQFLIKQALDVGVFGVMLPHIETRGEALAAVQATVLAATRAKGIPCGITAKWATVKQRMAEGFQLITLGDDSGLSHSAGQALRVARRALRRDD